MLRKEVDGLFKWNENIVYHYYTKPLINVKIDFYPIKWNKK